MTPLTLFTTTLYTDDSAYGRPGLPVRIVFSYTPETPETGAGYLADPDKYDAGSPSEVDVREIWLEPAGGEPSTVAKNGALWTWLVGHLADELEAHAKDAAAPDPDAHREMLAERRAS